MKRDLRNSPSVAKRDQRKHGRSSELTKAMLIAQAHRAADPVLLIDLDGLATAFFDALAVPPHWRYIRQGLWFWDERVQTRIVDE